MRLAVSYKVDRLPLAYRMLVLSLIKEAIRQVDESYYHKLYVEQAGQMKPFGSAVYLHHYQMQQDYIELKEITITISSSDMEFMLHLFNGLQQLVTYTPSGETWTRTNIRMLKEAQIKSQHAIFSTMSPILLESKDGKPIHPDDENYSKEFDYYAALRIRELTGREPYSPIVITPMSMRRQVVKETNSSMKNRYLYFTAYKGQLHLTGHPDDLQLLYQNGVGKRTSQFFGLLQYEREEM